MKERYDALMRDDGFVERLLAQNGEGEIRALFLENGVELTPRMLQALVGYVRQCGGALADENLDSVNGGSGATSRPPAKRPPIWY